MKEVFSTSIEKNLLKNELKINENLPDVYYIILDEYPNNESLKKFYEFDNNKFLISLEDSGFYVIENSFSNYPMTIQSLSSSLNMEYLDRLTKDVDINSQNYRLLNELLSDIIFNLNTP